MLAVLATAAFNVSQSKPAQADPACQENGVYVVWARGSGQELNDVEALRFKEHVFYALDAAIPGVRKEWAELGNLYPDYKVEGDDYPAASVENWRDIPFTYGPSVRKGTDELVNHLNDRYNGDGPTGSGPCGTEHFVLGGYSQGADVVGWALQRFGTDGYVGLTFEARSHLAYVALYGDPKANGFMYPCPPWLRGNASCVFQGVATARDPYVPNGYQYKVGSWCDHDDGVCRNVADIPGNHTRVYRDWWIWQSAAEIAQAAKFKRQGCYPLCAVQEVSIGPSDQIAMYTPLNWSFRVWNNVSISAAVQRVVVAIRGPSGNALDVVCTGGTFFQIQPNQQWTCNANLPQGFGQPGTYQFWADWLDYQTPGQWHQGQLGPIRTFTVTQAPTLSVAQGISVGPSNYRPKLTPLWWSYRVRNTSGSYASVQRFVVAVRGPAGDALDVPCLNGNGVTLAPLQEWTCDAQLPSGYGSTGNFTFWADWMDYNGSGQWHHGSLGGNQVVTLY